LARGGARPGSGRKPGALSKTVLSEEKKRKNRSFKASDIEWDIINQNAKEACISVSKHIRESAMEKK
jgi:hypothetical protein